jgi:hypothetical protein
LAPVVTVRESIGGPWVVNRSTAARLNKNQSVPHTKTLRTYFKDKQFNAVWIQSYCVLP